MDTNKFIFPLLFLLLASFAYADMNSDISAYYAMEDVGSPISDSTGNFSFAAANVGYGSGGIIGDATLWGGNDDNYSTGMNTTNGGSYTVNAWLVPYEADDNTVIAGWGGYSWMMAGATDGFCSSNKFCCRDYDGDSDIVQSTTSFTTGTWNMVTCICNAGNNTLMIAVNGTIEASDTSSSCSNAVVPWIMGDKMFQHASDFDGRIDEVAIWQGFVLSETNITYLFNAGAPGAFQQWQFGVGAVPGPWPGNASLVYPSPGELNQSLNNWTLRWIINASTNSTCTLNDSIFHKEISPYTNYSLDDGAWSDKSTIFSSNDNNMSAMNGGNDHVSIPNGYGNFTSNQYTTMFWIYNNCAFDCVALDAKTDLDINEVGGVHELRIGSVHLGASTNQKLKWHHVTIACNETICNFFSNATLHNTTGRVNLVNVTALGRASTSMIGNIDEFKMWSRYLNSTEITAEMNSPLPLHYDNLEYYLGFNNYDLFSFGNETLPDGNYSVTWNCENGGGQPHNNMTDSWISHDTTSPTIMTGWPALDNSSLVNGTNYSVTLNVTVSDNNLYLVNLTILNATGFEVYNNYTNVSALGYTSYNFNASLDFLGNQSGVYRVLVEGTDSHTSKTIEDFSPDIYLSEKKIKYKSTSEYGNIDFEIQADAELDDLVDVKKTDRHSPVFKFKEKEGEKKYKFTITSNQPLVYMGENNHYNAWFTSLNGMRGVWFDANFNNDFGADYDIKCKSAYECDIEITTDQNTIQFNSLGGLNYNSKNITFEILENLTIAVNDTIAGILIHNFTVTADGVTRTANGTNITMYVSANTTHIINASKVNYLITDAVVNMSFYPINITMNGSSAGVQVLILNETTREIISGINVTVELIGNTTNTYYVTTGSRVITGLGTGDYEIRTQSNYHNYRSIYTALNFSTIQNITLYMLDNSVSDYLDVVVRDLTLTGISNSTVTLQRWYSSLGAGVTVAEGRTNPQGLYRFYINRGGAYYKLFVTYNGSTIYGSPEWELINRDTYRITTDTEDYYTAWPELEGALSFNNVTYTYSLVYNNKPAGVNVVCLQTWKDQSTGLTYYNNSCLTANSGTITQTINKNESYTAWAYINLTDNTRIWLNSSNYIAIQSGIEKELKTSGWGIILSIVLFLAMVFGTLVILRDLNISVAMGMLSLLISKFLNWFPLSWYAFGIIIPGGVAIMYYINKRE